MLFLVANKSDLDVLEEIREIEGRRFAMSINAFFVTTSCLNNSNVLELFELIGTMIIYNQKEPYIQYKFFNEEKDVKILFKQTINIQKRKNSKKHCIR